MTENEINIAVRLSVQRALLGAISPGVRLVTVGWEGMELFTLRVYFDKEPTEDQLEDFGVVSSEVIADIPFEKDHIECIYSKDPLSILDILKHIVFSRKEN